MFSPKNSNSSNFISKISLLGVGFIAVMGVGLVYPMFSAMLFDPNLNYLPADASDTVRGFYLGLLLCMLPIAQFFSSPILGALSDRIGRKKILVYSLLFEAFGYLIALLGVHLESIWTLVLSRLLIGIPAGAVAVVGAALTENAKEEEKAQLFGLQNMSCGIGFAVGPFLGGLLSLYSFSLPFALASVASLLNMAMVALFYFQGPFEPKEANMSPLMGLKSIHKAFQMPTLRSIFLTTFFCVAGWSFFWEFIPTTWIREYNFTSVEIGQFFGYGALVYALGSGILIRPIVKRWSAETVLFYACLANVFAIGATAWINSPQWLWLLIPFQQFFLACFFPTSATVVSKTAPADEQGEAIGVLYSIEAFGLGVSPMISGSLLGLHIMMPVFVGALGFFIAAIAMFPCFRKQALVSEGGQG